MFDEETHKCLSVAGYRVQRSLYADGQAFVYIDDLVTDISARSMGCGKMLFDYMTSEAQRLGFFAIFLDSGLQRTKAHEFYRKIGMTETALHFSSLL